MTALMIFLLTISLYNLAFYGLGLFVTNRKTKELNREGKSNRFLCVVMAHNEERVIGNLLSDLSGQSHQNCRVVVVADHCTDKTEQIASNYSTSIFRRSTGKRGKQYALADFLKDQSVDAFDYVAVFDADNRIGSDFLEVMNAEVNAGKEIVQSYLDVVHKGKNWVARSYEINYRMMNQVQQKARSFLGLSAYLGGTGYVVSTKVLRKVSFDCQSLVDDLEYSIRLILDGYKVGYTDLTRVYDEKPLSFKRSYIQRLRWVRGTFEVSLKNFGNLLIRLLLFRKWVYLDAIIVLLSQYIGLIGIPFLLLSFFSFKGLITYFLIQSFYLFVFVLMDDRSKPILFLFIPFAVILNMSNMVTLVHGFFTQSKKSWIRTEHIGM